MSEIYEKRKKTIFEMISDKNYVPLKEAEIALLLQIKAEDRVELSKVLGDLIKEYKIIKTKKGKYMLNEDDQIVTGVFSMNRKGFGFLRMVGEDEDIFIPPTKVGEAFDGDEVVVKIQEGAKGKRKEGTIVGILKRNTVTVVGEYRKVEHFGFVLPDSQVFHKDIYIPKNKNHGAVSGHKVLVKMTEWGKNDKNPEGEVIEILGHKNDPGVDILSIIYEFNLPTEFPQEVLKEVESTPETVNGSEFKKRRDLRNVTTVTIDGDDAKDLDDAITLLTLDNGHYQLGVHIADVTHYVREKTALDGEAINRGTSVYLVDRVIPMLPHILSNGICSLNQGVDRLALSCIMEIDNEGHMLSQEVVESIINVDKRMSYNKVAKYIESANDISVEDYKPFHEMIFSMRDLAAILRQKRKTRGSIDFDFPECKIILDEKGKPIDIKAYERNVATSIIEEFMLMANETVAESFFWQDIPFVYRVHAEPDPTKIEALTDLIHNLGIPVKKQAKIHPKQIQQLLADIDGKKEEPIITRLTLRSMKRAEYTTENTGHFGLAAKYYCHFTSPIRRYPDLQIHRIIKETLNGKMNDKRVSYLKAYLPDVAQNSSKMERRADDAERETEKLKKVQYMTSYIGNTFEGIISSVTNWGIYVEMENTVEGLIHISNIKGDYYVFDDEKHMLIGERSGNTYQLGEKIRVILTKADLDSRTLDFDLIGKVVSEQE